MKDIGFDIISDLYLSPDDSFNWEGKATSLYCIIAGNISNDTRTFILTLSHLSKFYQGVFFTTGQYDVSGKNDIEDYNSKISHAFEKKHNITSLYQNVVIIDGIAIIGVNGWTGNINRDEIEYLESKRLDITYLYTSIQKLQKHLDVRKICVVSSCVPGRQLYFGEEPDSLQSELPLQSALVADTEHKVTDWVFGTYEKEVDTFVEGIHYVNNPYYKKRPYWPKRLTIEI